MNNTIGQKSYKYNAEKLNEDHVVTSGTIDKILDIADFPDRSDYLPKMQDVRAAFGRIKTMAETRGVHGRFSFCYKDLWTIDDDIDMVYDSLPSMVAKKLYEAYLLANFFVCVWHPVGCPSFNSVMSGNGECKVIYHFCPAGYSQSPNEQHFYEAVTRCNRRWALKRQANRGCNAQDSLVCGIIEPPV